MPAETLSSPSHVGLSPLHLTFTSGGGAPKTDRTLVSEMAFSQADLDAIRAAIAKGEVSVTLDGRTITYRSIGELLQAEQRIASALSTRVKQTLVVASKGFC
jgi:hypothetical protein